MNLTGLPGEQVGAFLWVRQFFEALMQQIIVGHVQFTNVVLFFLMRFMPSVFFGNVEPISFIHHSFDYLLLRYEASVDIRCGCVLLLYDHLLNFLSVAEGQLKWWFLKNPFFSAFSTRRLCSSCSILILFSIQNLFILDRQIFNQLNRIMKHIFLFFLMLFLFFNFFP